MTGKRKNKVKFGERNIVVRYIDFQTLIDGIKTKCSVIISDYLIQYQDEDNEWIEIHDDADLEDVSEKTKMRIVSKNPGMNFYFKRLRFFFVSA